ncbi:hypothetical protein CC79DRAFT_730683 [Sarocladium strictum]
MGILQPFDTTNKFPFTVHSHREAGTSAAVKKLDMQRGSLSFMPAIVRIGEQDFLTAVCAVLVLSCVRLFLEGVSLRKRRRENLGSFTQNFISRIGSFLFLISFISQAYWGWALSSCVAFFLHARLPDMGLLDSLQAYSLIFHCLPWFILLCLLAAYNITGFDLDGLSQRWKGGRERHRSNGDIFTDISPMFLFWCCP